MNQYPAWKYIMLIAIVAVSALLALPNIYGEDPAVQVSMANGKPLVEGSVDTVKKTLSEGDHDIKAIASTDNGVLIRFKTTEAELAAEAALKNALGEQYAVAVNLAPSTPSWMQSMGLTPMNLGLDLRGGVHFLLQVDIDAAVDQALDGYRDDLQDWLRQSLGAGQAAVRRQDDKIVVRFHTRDARTKAEGVIRDRLSDSLTLNETRIDGNPALIAKVPEKDIAKLKSNAVGQNIAALRNRLNNLGVAEPLIQRQGSSQIVVELPGVQDIAQAKQSLHAKATVEFHLVDMKNSAFKAQRTGHIPLNSQLYTDTPTGNPLLLKREVIASGKGLTGASPAPNSQGPGWVVNINLNSQAASRMLETTRKNYKKNMAVLLIQDETKVEKVDGKLVRHHKQTKRVINNATIQGVFSNRFQISGLSKTEATKLATQLKYALAVPMDIVGQRVVGSSLGVNNIKQGVNSLVIGFLAVVFFMFLCYKMFGLFADAALLMNVVIIVAVLSLLGATLTLPGIAGIVLTVGMAVDANVLVYERIREELRNGCSPQAAIYAGYERAWSAILDANVTTLIVGLVLFMFGSGPIKGFAVTLSIGVLTSMFTAIVGTRALANVVYGNRRVKKLHV